MLGSAESLATVCHTQESFRHFSTTLVGLPRTSMKITEADLKIAICPSCNAERKVWHPAAGSGYRSQIPCPDCEGRGWKLTPTGAKLFDFVREVLRVRPV